ncbi:glutamine amidotransferase [Botrimarina hoheduenensis]|uniref:Putative glutamine amidotransferase domain-containing protein n=1 Tax=Botrimarina hoheduenensis TaxID=2528000 RepID=A0A5C5W6E3_9BACT|nr:glutamine amidotransferase [Botrimarina hoheduenensis]TWT46456.1 hypothetical protein Pla111_15520 [Botrimarina hoheduenensis]
MSSWEATIDPVGGPILTTLLAGGLLALCLLVKPVGVALTPRRRGWLTGLRLMLWLAVLAAWLRPTLLTVASEPIASAIGVLLDASRSMGVADAAGGRTRWQVAKQSLAAAEPALVQLAEREGLRLYRFGEGVQPLSGDPARIEGEPTETGSAIGAAIDEVIADTAAGQLTAVILLSDGAQRANSSSDTPPLAAARRLATLGTPLYAVPIGDRNTGLGVDLAIEDLAVSPNAFAGAPLSVRAVLRAAGLPNRRVAVQLLWENAQGGADLVQTQPLVLRPGQATYPLALQHVPTTPGEWKLTLRVPGAEGETVTANNEQGAFVTVREGGVRVLYLTGAARIGGAPSIEQRFVRASLGASPDVSVERIVFNYRQPGRDLTERFRLGVVDLVVLDDLDSIALSQSSWRALADAVTQGVGLLMIGGRHSFGPGGYRDTPLAEVLPLTLGRAERQAFGQPVREDMHVRGPLRIEPVADAEGIHPLLRIAEDNAAAWKKLPPLDGANRLDRTRLRLNARVLAVAAGAERTPLLVAGQPGVGRVLAMAGDSTWRWVLAGYGEEHRRFWRQAALWLVKKDEIDGEAVRVRLSARRVNPGERLDVTAEVRLPADQQEDPSRVRYSATVTLPSGATQQLALTDGRVRSTAGFFATAEPGDYRVRVSASMADKPLGEATARFLVPRRDLELDRPAAEPDRLERMAAATSDVGGKTIAPEELPDLLAELARQKPEQRRQITSRYTPWDDWPFFLLVIGLMGADWGLRRRWGLP